MVRDWIFFGILLGSAGLGSACTMRVAYNVDPTPPFTVGVGQVIPKSPGISVELIRQSAATVNCELELIRLPGSRGYEWVQQGLGDGAFFYSDIAKSAETWAYPLDGAKPDRARRVNTLSYVIYVAQESTLKWDGRKFEGLNGPVAVNLGWSIAEDLRGAGVKVLETYSSQEAMKNLRLGRVAAYVTLVENGENAIARAGLDGITQLSIPFVSKDYFLVFSQEYYRKHSALVESLWNEIGSRRDEMTQRLMPHYQFNGECVECE